ncbi:MAG: FG-GAP-like repeat-containing protein, partial [Candidatus Zixiibacteriota bacterium]
SEYSGHSAVGDIDDNGYPDFVVSNFLGSDGFSTPNHSNMYLNPSGLPNQFPDWYTADSIYSFSCALGDVDGDGDLDLAVATGEGYTNVLTPDAIYFNISGSLQTSPGWQSAQPTAAMDVTWGDVDNDGDLDLAFCYDVIGAAVHYNNNGNIETTPSWQTNQQEPANTLIFADANNDGWLDLIIAFNDQLGGSGYFRLYLNDGAGSLNTNSSWQSATGGYGSAVSVYDYDNDGDDDLAAGRWWDNPRIYENIGGTYTSTPVWTANPAVVVEELAWVDIDGDGIVLRTDTFLVADSRRLFYTKHHPLYSIDSVLVDGSILGNPDFCYDLIAGWVSLGLTPVDSVVVFYQYSFKNDLTVANWDTYNMAFANTNKPKVDMFADVTFGWAPLMVQFSDSSAGSTEWNWQFGDSNSSPLQNPSHIYSEGGAYDVSLDALLSDGWYTRTIRRMIIALADTVIGDDVVGEEGNSVEMIVYARNNFPLEQINLPVEFSGSLPLSIDSFSTVGCRTDYFEIQEYLHWDPFNKRVTIKLQNSTNRSQPELAPGAGEILKLYFTIISAPQPDITTEIIYNGYLTYEPMCYGSVIDYQPWIISGSVTSAGCCVGTRGNIDGIGEEGSEIDIADLVYFVDYSFSQPPGPEPPCPEEADVDGSGTTDIADIVYMVDFMFSQPPGPAPVDCP